MVREVEEALDGEGAGVRMLTTYYPLSRNEVELIL